jgi:hypothetical protein
MLARSAAKRITHKNDEVLHKNTSVEPPGNDLPPPANERQNPQGEPLNLDVLLLVRALPFIFVAVR